MCRNGKIGVNCSFSLLFRRQNVIFFVKLLHEITLLVHPALYTHTHTHMLLSSSSSLHSLAATLNTSQIIVSFSFVLIEFIAWKDKMLPTLMFVWQFFLIVIIDCHKLIIILELLSSHLEVWQMNFADEYTYTHIYSKYVRIRCSRKVYMFFFGRANDWWCYWRDNHAFSLNVFRNVFSPDYVHQKIRWFGWTEIFIISLNSIMYDSFYE